MFYCPNHHCIHHCDPAPDFYKKYGFAKGKQRFRCKTCGRTFGASNFTLDYRMRKRGLFETIFQQTTQGMSNRSIARTLNMAESSVRDRLKHLSRQALLHWEERQRKVKLEETIVYDGFESFVFSQYDPNNLNHAVGQGSLFVFDFNYAHLNRKGRMTEAQRRKLARLEEKRGRYPKNRIQVQTQKLLEHLRPQELLSDEHHSYTRAIAKLDFSIKHQQVSSKQRRDKRNPLFPVNHLDMKLRHFLKSLTRETIAFNKNEMGLIDRVVLFLARKNFLAPQFVKEEKQRDASSPGMLVGAADKILKFSEFFWQRKTKYQIQLREEWQSYYQRIVECSFLPCVPYYGL